MDQQNQNYQQNNQEEQNIQPSASPINPQETPDDTVVFSPLSNQEKPVPPVESYTAPPYDRYQVPVKEPDVPVQDSKKKKERKTVPFSTAIIMSVLVSVLSGILVLLVTLYGLRVGDILTDSDEKTITPSPSSSSSGESQSTTTNIVVDTTSQTSAEAVAQKAGPSVVGIVVKATTNHYFYGESDASSEGSGIVYTKEGYILTNYHVISQAVEGNGKVSVYLPSDSETPLTATVIGYDVSCDLAVIRVTETTNLVPIELGDSDAIKVGQTAIAIGNPGGMDFMGSVSMGIISGLDRTLQIETTYTEIQLIQTDAAINPGNSGGALVDVQGKLIGINSAKMTSENFEGMGFAIPVNDAVEIANRIINNIDAPQPYLGVEIDTYYTSETLQMMGYPAGVVVATVTQNSPAEKAGIQPYDIITEFNSVPIGSYTQLNSERLKYKPGDTVTVTVYRQGQTVSVNLTLGTANQ